MLVTQEYGWVGKKNKQTKTKKTPRSLGTECSQNHHAREWLLFFHINQILLVMLVFTSLKWVDWFYRKKNLAKPQVIDYKSNRKEMFHMIFKKKKKKKKIIACFGEGDVYLQVEEK